jgi:phosphatidylglycerol:prolipoprotein diacylglycerol transferase
LNRKGIRLTPGLVFPALYFVALAIVMVIRGVPTWRGEGHPGLFEIGGFTVRLYGVMLMTGAFAGALVGQAEARRRGLNEEHVWNILFWGLIFGVIFARLWFVVGRWSYYTANPLEIIGIERGRFVGLRGLTLHGALIGAIVSLLFYTRRRRIDFFTWLDVGAPGFVMGQSVGRWGNFFNQEAYGWRTSLPWGLRIGAEFRIDAVHRVNGVRYILPEYSKLALGSPECGQGLACYTNLSLYPPETRFHPTFLYESLWNFLLCLFLLWFARRFGERLVRGEVFWVYGILYSVGRFANEFLRVDSEYLGPYPAAQVVSVVILVISLGFLVGRRWIWKRAPGALPPSVAGP